jgi:hypothetical protein
MPFYVVEARGTRRTFWAVVFLDDPALEAGTEVGDGTVADGPFPERGPAEEVRRGMEAVKEVMEDGLEDGEMLV